VNGTHSPTGMESRRYSWANRTRSIPVVSDDLQTLASLDARHEQWLREQYLRDLETLDRIEQQRGEQDGCFFAAMGELHQRRTAP
jgi:hypothetical protein